MGEVKTWQEIRRAIDARQIELGLSLGQLVERSGVSDTTLRKMGEGVPLVRPVKRAGLCRALQWSTNSIDRLLDGLPPIEVGVVVPATITERLDALEERVALFDSEKEAVTVFARSTIRRLADLEEMVEGLHELVTAAIRQGPPGANRGDVADATPTRAEQEPS